MLSGVCLWKAFEWCRDNGILRQLPGGGGGSGWKYAATCNSRAEGKATAAGAQHPEERK